MKRSEYRQVVLNEKDRLTTYSAWVLHDAEEACDVTQESFLRLWERVSWVKVGAARTWLFRTAHRLCIDRIRKRNRRAEVSFDEVAMSPLRVMTNAEEVMSGIEVRRDLDKALGKLSPKDRAMLVLREVEGLNLEQIAEVMSSSTGAVKVALHRARRRLREQLTGSWIEEVKTRSIA